MAQAGDVARELVAFDERLARHVLGMVCGELGGPGTAEPDDAQAFLSRLDVEGDDSKTTREWKAGFAHVERLRALGLALAELLD
jgi:hypothetical protein